MTSGTDIYQYYLNYAKRLEKIQSALLRQQKSQTHTSQMKAFQAYQQSMIDIGTKFWTNIWENPDHFIEAQKKLIETLGVNTQSPNEYSKYFKSDLWNTQPWFQWCKDTYIKTAHWLIETIESEAMGLNLEEKGKLKFVTQQFIDGMNPRNFPMTNPDVIEETIKTGGENILRGMDNLIKDIEQGTISMTDKDSFVVGKNIATTKGAVIYKNHMMELIQYTPSTKAVESTPVLIIPPWINKYYILDLRDDNSFIKWMVDQGHTVFCISWKNPDETYKNIGFKDYMHDGVLQATNVVKDITGQDQIHAVGYCIGGTLLAMTMAWVEGQKNKKPSPFKTGTFLTTLLDFKNAGDIKAFIDDNQLQALQDILDETGIMDGKMMGMTFSMLRSADLIWSFIINNYLMGKSPIPFDLLYWNGDSTNLPAAMHLDYLKSLYIDNKLAKGTYILDGVQLDLSKIKTPAYFFSAREDHIAPWHATQTGSKNLGGNVRFCLGGSGHVAGVINPPHKNKYGYTIKNKKHNGSWWTDWDHWIKSYNDKPIPATKRAQLGNKEHKALSNAPGTYILEKT